MHILLNGDREALANELTVLELIQKYEFNPDVVTVSLNGDILQRKDFAGKAVKDGDSVDILMFMGGGQENYEH